MVIWEQQRQGASHLANCLGTEEFESSLRSIRVTRPFLAGNGSAPCSNTTINKSHEFFDQTGIKTGDSCGVLIAIFMG